MVLCLADWNIFLRLYTNTYCMWRVTLAGAHEMKSGPRWSDAQRVAVYNRSLFPGSLEEVPRGSVGGSVGCGPRGRLSLFFLLLGVGALSVPGCRGESQSSSPGDDRLCNVFMDCASPLSLSQACGLSIVALVSELLFRTGWALGPC
jgi:hypothetical protein